jgi:hypothetical protein
MAGLSAGGVVVTLADETVLRVSPAGDVIGSGSLEEVASAVAVDERGREIHTLSHRGGVGTVFGLDDFEVRAVERPYGAGPSFSLACSRNGEHLVAGSRERPGNIVLSSNHEFDEDARIRKVGHSGNVWHIGFIDGDRHIVSGGVDGRVIVHRIDEVEPLQTIFEFNDRVRGLAISADSRAIAVTDGRIVRIADPNEGLSD